MIDEDKEWAIQMRKIVNDAYGEGWEDTIPNHLWESRYNDAAKLNNMLNEWLRVNEPKLWLTLKPLLIEWLKMLVTGEEE